MAKYRKKPVVIEAVRFVGADTIDEVLRFCPNAVWHMGAERLTIRTLEGTMTAFEGDWIIRGIKGEFYPCKPDIFNATYDCVEE